jgi:hypothetical protein
MSKKMKLALKDLNVQSFVTSLREDEKGKVAGGATHTRPDCCTYGCTDWLCTHTQVPTGDPCKVCD